MEILSDLAGVPHKTAP